MKFKLMEIRQKMGMTQQQFAQFVGLPQTTVSSLERNIRIPKAPALIKIARAIGCTVEDLVDESEKA